MKCASKYLHAPMQFIIYPTQLPSAFKLVCRETKSRQHEHKNQTIPDLQPPFDGVENFHSMQ